MAERNGCGVVVAWGANEEIHAPNFEAVGGLADAMSQAIADVGGVVKAGRNKDQGYAYTTAGDADAAIGVAMAKHGLSFAMSTESVEQERVERRAYSRVWYRWAILHKGGAIITGRWVAEALDTGMADKGINKCATAAGKYLKLRLFVVATEDESDADAGEQPKREWQGAAQGATRQPAPAPVRVAAGGDEIDVRQVVAQVQGTAAKLAQQGYTSEKLAGFQKAQQGNLNEALLGLGYAKEEADTMAHMAISVLFGREHFGELTAPECSALGRWLRVKGEDGQYVTNPSAVRALEAIVKAAEGGAFDEPEPPDAGDGAPF